MNLAEVEVQEVEVQEAEAREAEAWEAEEWEEGEFVHVAAPVPPPKPRCFLGDILLEVDIRLARMIIGPGAATIQGLRRDSGAFISVIDSSRRGKKTVKIWGSVREKRVAKRLIKEFIDSNKREKDQEHSVEEATKGLNNTPKINTKDSKAKITKKRLSALPLIVKSFYKEHPEVTALSDQQVVEFRLSMNITRVECTNKNSNVSIPKPVLKFIHVFEDYPEFMEEIQRQKFEIPSPVQCQAWPIIMNGHDLIAVATTGTGKTLAYLLPAFIHIDLQQTPRKVRKGPTVLVLAPTRELVVQIDNEAKKYAPKGIKSMSLYVGYCAEKQKECLLEGVEIVIATPSRLNEFINSGLIDLSEVSYLILDDADRMLDLGTELYVRSSLSKVRPNRQTLVTSATWPSRVQQFAKSVTINSLQIMIGSLVLTNSIKQDIFLMEQKDKKMWLEDFLKNITEEDKVIIFVNQKWNVDELSIFLCTKGFNIDSTHGGREKIDLEMTLDNLRSHDGYILLTTEETSCDIDVDNVTILINYDFPYKIEEYINRFGRFGLTGRAEKMGHAITLMTKCDLKKSKFLVQLMKKSGPIEPPELRDMAAKRFEASLKSY